MKYIILDTETTGLYGKIIELAFLVVDGDEFKMHHTYCKADVPIEFGSMATHNITEEMVADKLPLVETNEFKILQDLNTPDNTMVIHNSKFDLEMLKKEGFESKMQLIDTLTIAKHLLPRSEMFKMQYFRYKMGLYHNEKPLCKKNNIDMGDAHSANGDVIVLYLLLTEFLKTRSNDELIELTKKQPLLYLMPFGKHKGIPIKDIVRDDKQYVKWMLNKMPDLSDELRHTLTYYLNNEITAVF